MKEYVEALAVREGIALPASSEGYTTLVVAILIGIAICCLVGLVELLILGC